MPSCVALRMLGEAVVRRTMLGFTIGFLFIGCVSSQNQDEAIEIVPNDRCVGDIARFDGWQGDYPSPVVHVMARTTQPAYTDPCHDQAASRCTLRPGVYHPWGDQDLNFATVRAIARYTANRPVVIDRFGVVLEPGAEISVIAYMADGLCTWQVDDQQFDEVCPDRHMDGQEPVFTRLNPDTTPQTQLFLTRCVEGGMLWIAVNDELLADPYIAEGEILGPGLVGPSKVAPTQSQRLK